MTKEHPSLIPEDLYNLTQLAEVATSRLSAGHVAEIKDYIDNNKYLNYCYEKARQSACSIPHIQYVPHWRFQPIDIHEAMNFHKQYQELYPLTTMRSNANSLEDKNKINDEIARNSNSCQSSKTTDCELLLSNQSTTRIMHQFANCSSSDDDCNYYSHKVFDRKKLRRFTLPDNSSSDTPTRYDEHSCSSMPSCSGDEQQLTTKTTTTAYMSVDAAHNNNKTYNANDSNELILNLSEDVHICSECGKKYSTSSNLARHRQTHRSIMDKKARRCPYCEKVYVSMPAFSMHVRTHNQGCECPFCGKCFSRPWLLQGHIRTHTGEKPFKCNICDKAFADKSNLRAHIQTHSNVKPHTCARCNKAFALKSYLYKHEESSCMKNTHRDDRKLRQLARAAANG